MTAFAYSGAVLLALLGLSRAAGAAPIESRSETLDGRAVQTITWTDQSGNPRSVAVLADNMRIVRYSYNVDGETIVDSEIPNYGIGNMVHHGACGAVTSWDATEEYSAAATLAGPHHYVWRSTFRLPMCDHTDVRWRVTNEYFFSTGSDHFIQTVAYDASDLPADQPMNDDMRGPYSQTDWPGSGNISGFGWGGEYRFVTTAPIPDGDANVGGSVAVSWDWTQPNTIPYVWEWADPSQGGAVDREYGIVQNQAYAEQDFGGGYYGCGVDCWASAPPLSGNALPASWALPTQVSAYDSNYRSGRITWGGIYGAFENGHSNDTGSIANMGDHFRPINAWSFTHVVGKFTDRGLLARVTDTENIYASRLTASVGSVRLRGPRGAGDFVGPDVGSMPELDYSNPGYEFIHRTWNITAAAGAAEFSLDVAGSLMQPVFVIHDLANADASVELDGVVLVPEQEVFTSLHEERLYVGLNQTLSAGPHTLRVVSGSDVEPGAGGAAAVGGNAGSGNVPPSGDAGNSSGNSSGGSGGEDAATDSETAGETAAAGTPGNSPSDSTTDAPASPAPSTSEAESAASSDEDDGPTQDADNANDSDDGCGCRLNGSANTNAGWLVLLGVLLGLCRRYRS